MYIANTKAILLSMLWYIPVLSLGIVLYLVSVLELKTLLVFVISLIGILPLVRATATRGSDALSPTVLLPITYLLYALGPLQVAAQFSQHVVSYYLILQLLGLIAMRLGLHLSTKRRHSSPTAHPTFGSLEGSSKTLLAMTFAGIMILSAISLATYLAAFGGLTGFLQTGYGGQYFLILQEATVIGAGFEWLLLGAALLAFYGLKLRSKPYLFAGAALFILIAYIILLVGRRSQLLYPLLFAVALFTTVIGGFPHH